MTVKALDKLPAHSVVGERDWLQSSVEKGEKMAEADQAEVQTPWYPEDHNSTMGNGDQ